MVPTAPSSLRLPGSRPQSQPKHCLYPQILEESRRFACKSSDLPSSSLLSRSSITGDTLPVSTPGPVRLAGGTGLRDLLRGRGPRPTPQSVLRAVLLLPPRTDTLPLDIVEPPSFPPSTQSALFHCVCREGLPSRWLTSFCSLSVTLSSAWILVQHLPLLSHLKIMAHVPPPGSFPVYWVCSMVSPFKSRPFFLYFFKLLLLS